MSCTKLSKKIVINEICEKYAVKREYIDLFKDCGSYHLTDKAGSLMDDSNFYIDDFSSKPISSWLCRFNQMLVNNDMKDGHDLNEVIEQINWNFDE